MSIAIPRSTLRMAALGPYQVLADLGAVPWGTAHAALDLRSDREVVLLAIPDSRRGADEGEVPWEVLLSETLALARIYHPGIPAVYEVSEQEGEILVASAVTPGCTLDEALQAGLLPGRGQIADWGCQLLDVLAEAHGHGLLHRHLGEGEVILGPAGRLAVTGFGLTRRSFEPLARVAPEMREGSPATRRSDLYAVGALLRRLARLARLATDDPLVPFLARATAWNPAARYESAVQMAEALAALAALPTAVFA